MQAKSLYYISLNSFLTLSQPLLRNGRHRWVWTDFSFAREGGHAVESAPTTGRSMEWTQVPLEADPVLLPPATDMGMTYSRSQPMATVKEKKNLCFQDVIVCDYVIVC